MGQHEFRHLLVRRSRHLVGFNMVGGLASRCGIGLRDEIASRDVHRSAHPNPVLFAKPRHVRRRPPERYCDQAEDDLNLGVYGKTADELLKEPVDGGATTESDLNTFPRALSRHTTQSWRSRISFICRRGCSYWSSSCSCLRSRRPQARRQRSSRASDAAEGCRRQDAALAGERARVHQTSGWTTAGGGTL